VVLGVVVEVDRPVEAPLVPHRSAHQVAHVTVGQRLEREQQRS
jgi:hypothetical protein